MMKNFDKLIENVVRSVISEAGFDNNAYRRDRYATDAEYREKIKARSRAYVPSREVRDRRNARVKNC